MTNELIENENNVIYIKNNSTNSLCINPKQEEEAKRIEKGLLKVNDMNALHIKSKHPELYKILLDIESGVE